MVYSSFGRRPPMNRVATMRWVCRYPGGHTARVHTRAHAQLRVKRHLHILNFYCISSERNYTHTRAREYIILYSVSIYKIHIQIYISIHTAVGVWVPVGGCVCVCVCGVEVIASIRYFPAARHRPGRIRRRI